MTFKDGEFFMSEAEYVELTNSDLGLCRGCGVERECCEPDATNYSCEGCGETEVFGAEMLMVMGLIDFVE